MPENNDEEESPQRPKKRTALQSAVQTSAELVKARLVLQQGVDIGKLSRLIAAPVGIQLSKELERMSERQSLVQLQIAKAREQAEIFHSSLAEQAASLRNNALFAQLTIKTATLPIIKLPQSISAQLLGSLHGNQEKMRKWMARIEESQALHFQMHLGSRADHIQPIHFPGSDITRHLKLLNYPQLGLAQNSFKLDVTRTDSPSLTADIEEDHPRTDPPPLLMTPQMTLAELALVFAPVSAIHRQLFVREMITLVKRGELKHKGNSWQILNGYNRDLPENEYPSFLIHYQDYLACSLTPRNDHFPSVWVETAGDALRIEFDGGIDAPQEQVTEENPSQPGPMKPPRTRPNEMAELMCTGNKSYFESNKIYPTIRELWRSLTRICQEHGIIYHPAKSCFESFTGSQTDFEAFRKRYKNFRKNSID